MPPMQSAYRAGHSTETAVQKVLSDILNAVDSQETTLLGLLDMSAASDTVDFEILLRRLETSYRLDGTVLQWLTSFVTDRTQAVAFGGKTWSLYVELRKVPYWDRYCSYCMPLTSWKWHKVMACAFTLTQMTCRLISAVRLSTRLLPSVRFSHVSKI